MKSKKMFVLLAFVALVAIIIVCLIPNDKKKIRKQFDRAAENINKNQNESVIVNAAKSKAVASLLSDPCELSISVQFGGNLNGYYDKDKSAMILAGVRSNLNALNLTFHDMTINLEGKEKATVNLTVRMSGKTGGNEPFSETKEVVCVMVKADRKWLFKSCKAVAVFKK